VHHPNTIDALRFTTQAAFSCPMRARSVRRRSDAKFP
jgi:hypothetical protein